MAKGENKAIRDLYRPLDNQLGIEIESKIAEDVRSKFH